MSEPSTATVEAPAPAEQTNENQTQVAPKVDTRCEELTAVVNAEMDAWAQWQGDKRYPNKTDVPPYVSAAISNLVDTFGDGGAIPRERARLAVEVTKLRFAFMDWCRWDGVDGGDRFKQILFQARAEYAKERDRPKIERLPTVKELADQKVSHMQIAHMWRFFDANGNLRVSDVAAELSRPGSICTPEHIAGVNDFREGIPKPKSKADRFEGPRPIPVRSSAAKVSQSLEDLIRQQVPRYQIIDIKCRELPGSDSNAIAAMVDATAAAMGVKLPGSAAAGVAEAGQQWQKAERGMEQDAAISMPLSQAPGAPMPIEAINASVADAAAVERAVDVRDDGPTGSLADRCRFLYEQRQMSYQDIAETLGRELGGASEAKRVKKVERLVMQAIAGATESEEVEGIL